MLYCAKCGVKNCAKKLGEEGSYPKQCPTYSPKHNIYMEEYQEPLNLLMARVSGMVSPDHGECRVLKTIHFARECGFKKIGLAFCITLKDAARALDRLLEAEGFEVSYLHTNPQGYVSADELESIIRPDTILVSVMYANNEIGTIQPIDELAKVAHAHGAFFHTDAVQAVGNVHIDVKAQGIDLLSMSAHKFYGPKGIGCLYIKSGVRPERLICGGEQERNQRAGTTNTPGVVGMGFAIEKAVNNMDENNAYIAALRDEFVKEVKERIPDIRYNGGEKRLAGNAHFTFRYIEGESILFTLDLAGICASSGSACSSGSLEASKTVLAIGVPAEEAHGSIRFTFGRENTIDDVKYTVDELEKTVKRLRSMSPLFAESTAKITMI